MTKTRAALIAMTVGIIMIFGSVLLVAHPGSWANVGGGLFGVGIAVFLIGAIGYLLHPTSRR